MSSRYAQPIQDNINTIRDYDTVSKQKSFIREDRAEYKGILDALSNLIGGTFKSNDKQVFYYPKKERNRDKVGIPIYISSSSVKSLFLLDLYINCIAKKDDLLIIDEPEQVGAYTLNNHEIKSVEVTKYGINLEIFDDLIADTNSLSEKIYYSIED